MQDLRNAIEVRNALDYSVIVTDTETAGEIIDMQGYESAVFVMRAAVITDGTYIVTIEESDDSGMSGANDAVAPQIVGSAEFSGAGDSEGVATIGYVGAKRYIRFTVDTTVSATGNVLALVILANPRRAATPQVNEAP